MSFPRYPAYKDSGVEWLGSVPEHWRVDRLKASITSCRNGIWGDEAQDDENDIPCVRVADFDRQKLHVRLQQPTIRNVTEKERAHRLLKRGDLLLEKSGGGENQPVGCVVLYEDDRSAVCSNFVAKVEMAPSMDSSYWRYVHAAAYAVRLTIGSINQTSGIQNLDQDRYFNERAVFPPEQEQTAIGAFLDRETAKIDTLVAEQEQLITLLKEKRQAVISHAVTKGLDPSVPMKDSGIEWLGLVPEHWSVQPLGTLARAIQTGPFGSQLHSDEYVDDATPVINPSNIIDGQLCPEPSATVTDEVAERLSHHKLAAGDIVVGRRGEMGRCAVVLQSQVGWLCGTGCLKIQLNPTAFPEFVWRYLSTEIVKQYLSLQSVGSTMENLNTQILARVPVPVPPASEQAAICKAVSDELILMSELESEAIAGVQLLQERRSALISAAVTGQIDVRSLAPAQAQAA